ncbi:branched-chain amino acid transaminase [Candidatus Dependentiae bacterium]|nr:branched-chain amino acid transaminase [Candidatus Dependentiae bacterium]
MTLKKNSKIWMNGKFINGDDAKIHILSHVVHYGSSVFEGMRCYKNNKGSACFRIHEHMTRLINSGKIYRMEIPYSVEELVKATVETIKINNIESCYVRPISFRGYGEMGVNPFKCPIETAIAVWEWGKYLGDEGMEQGIDVCVSSWNRMAPNTMPTAAKAGANYMNSQLIKMEALLNGYSEGIGLDTNGYISEGSGENVFVVLKGKLYTPSICNSVLPGITRDSVITLAKENGIEVEVQSLSRELLYICDELFLTGSAAEITPVRSVDKIKVNTGKRGPITGLLQEKFFDIIEARVEDKHNWLTYVK